MSVALYPVFVVVEGSEMIEVRPAALREKRQQHSTFYKDACEQNKQDKTCLLNIHEENLRKQRNVRFTQSWTNTA